MHRDLKPGNIKLTEDGRIKVLDFGLAKAIAAAAGELSEADPANSPTITVHGTRQGVILGTAAYMSPEQARGRRIDKRTDIWAFGCVLFEMLTRKRAFTGETTSDVIAAILERAPDLSALPASTPPHVRRVIERCLEKDPQRRARDIADVRAALDDVSSPAPARVRGTGKSPWLDSGAALSRSRWPDTPSWRGRTARRRPRHRRSSSRLVRRTGINWSWRRRPASPDGTKVAFGARDAKQVSSTGSAIARRHGYASARRHGG